MKRVPRRFTGIAIGCAAIGATWLIAMPDGSIVQTAMLLVVGWLLLLGWGFHALLRRHLRIKDRLAELDTQLGIERHGRVLAERALSDTHGALCKLILGQEQVRETERKRIARDIHDDLGQNLLALKIELSLMQVSTNGAHPALHQRVSHIGRNLDLTIKSLRAIINDLRPLALEDGLQSAIERQLSEFSRINNIRHELKIDPGAFQAVPDKAVDAMLFRILQESLSNVARHAQATEVKIALNCSADQLTLEVQDNGIGMSGKRSSAGCGLVGIRDRVTAIGGKFSIDSWPGAGTLISLSIPLALSITTD